MSHPERSEGSEFIVALNKSLRYAQDDKTPWALIPWSK
jgi:hypothetical protein